VTVIAWILLLVAVVVLEGAKPERQTFLDKHWDKEVRTQWDRARAGLGLQILLGNLALCAVGLGFDHYRRRGRGGSFSKPLAAAATVTAMGIIMHLTMI